MLRILIIPLALLGMVLGAVLWSGGGSTRRAEFSFINRGDIYTLDLNQMSYMQDIRLTYAIREGLFMPAYPGLEPEPAGATGHKTSPDGRTWIFYLRRECRWSNGEAVRAADYLFSWRRMLEEPGEYTYLFYYITGAKKYADDIAAFYAQKAGTTRPSFDNVGLQAPDDLTLVVTLDDPVPYFLELLAFPPFYPRHEKSMEKFKWVQNEATGQCTYRNEYTRPPHVVTNGPFVLTRWDFKRRLFLEKSSTYWDKQKVRSNSVEMLVSENPLSQFLLYESGQVDWHSDVDGDLGAELLAKGRKDLRTAPAFGTAFLSLLVTPELPGNVQQQVGSAKNPLADVRVRQALAMSIDKEFIVQSITRMGELPARTYVPPDGTLKNYRWPAGLFNADTSASYSAEDVRQRLVSPDGLTGDGPGLPYDMARAKKLLAEAGYPGGKNFPALPIIYGTNSPARQKICQVLKRQWRENLGIEVVLQAMEGKNFRDRVSSKEYVIAPVAWYGDYPDASTFTDKYLSTSTQNDSDWKNVQYDQLCAAAAKEADEKKRLALLQQAEHLLNTFCPIIPLYHYVNVSLYRDNVQGAEPNGRNITLFKHVKVEK